MPTLENMDKERHLFLVHSFATYRCSLGVIEHQNLELESCIIVTDRGFTCSDLPKGISTGTISSLGSPNINSVKRVLKQRLGLSRRDREINELLGWHKFHCYIPHTYYDFAHLIVSHPKCTGFSYIEEGLTSYYKPGEIDKAYEPWSFESRVRLLRAIFYGSRLVNQVFFYSNNYKAVYGFCESSFPDWQNKVVLGVDKLFPRKSAQKLPHHPVLVFDALVELGRTSADSLCAALKQFLYDCKVNGVSELSFKLHPSQTKEQSISYVRSILLPCSFIKVQEMPQFVCLEDIFCDYALTVFIFNSASGVYAALSGNNVYSLNSYIEKEDREYSETLGRLPRVYNHLVKPYKSSIQYSGNS
ncbi:hypothetical protein NT6N_26740 [Oceaniferula spumae]|uniref:Uncharacterized protein n=1 Tax=Oceaniferula spumae TaxID=2979115 RepID=A0AAT9FNW3_9BACT